MSTAERSELEHNTATLVNKARGKQPEVVLDRIDTSVQSCNDNDKSSALSGLPGGFFSSRTRSGRTPRALELPSLAPQQRQPHKPLPDRPQQRRSSRRSPRQYFQDLIYSPRFGPRSPLSTAVLVSLQQALKAIVELLRSRQSEELHYLARPRKDPSYDGFNETVLEAQMPGDRQRRSTFTPKLELRQKVAIACCLTAMLTVVGLLIGFVRLDNMDPRQAAHWLMAGSGGIIILLALAMLAAGLPLVEILLMAVLVMIICQCVMNDFHAARR